MKQTSAHLRIAAAAAFAVALPLSSAWAGLDRPDILDVDSETFAPASGDLPSNLSYSYAYAAADQYDSILASGVAGGSASSNVAVVSWHIFEPDAVKRVGDGLAMRQSDYLGLFFYIYDGSGYASFSTASVEGCKAMIKVSGPDTDSTTAKWKVKCDVDTLANTFGLTPTQQQTLEDIFGGKVSLKEKGGSVEP